MTGNQYTWNATLGGRARIRSCVGYFLASAIAELPWPSRPSMRITLMSAEIAESGALVGIRCTTPGWGTCTARFTALVFLVAVILRLSPPIGRRGLSIHTQTHTYTHNPPCKLSWGGYG